jgi:hypothetical protein
MKRLRKGVLDLGYLPSQYKQTQAVISGLQQVIKGLRTLVKNKKDKNEK